MSKNLVTLVISIVVTLLGVSPVLGQGLPDPGGGDGTTTIGGGQGGSGKCAGDPPCPNACPNETEMCNGWDAECGCVGDKRPGGRDRSHADSVPTVTACFVVREDGDKVTAILDHVVSGSITHSMNWGGERQTIPISNLVITATKQGLREFNGTPGWRVYHVESVEGLTPEYNDVAILGSSIGPISFHLCSHGRNPSVAKILVRESDGCVEGWVPLDIDPPPNLPSVFKNKWKGPGYAAVAVRGFWRGDRILLAYPPSSAESSAGHPGF